MSHETGTGPMPQARRVALVRERPGTVEGADHTAHLLPLPVSGPAAEATALCGTRLCPGEIETVPPGEGVWCTMCFVCHVTGDPPALSDPDTTTGSARISAALTYRELGWPVTLRGEQVSLNLDLDVDAVALLIPVTLSAEVAGILVRRRCPPPVLAHPALPTHRIILAGERYGVPLAWPTGVHRVTGTLLLPPTITAYGPVQWVRPPQPDALRVCREIDVCAALRAALTEPPPRTTAALSPDALLTALPTYAGRGAPVVAGGTGNPPFPLSHPPRQSPPSRRPPPL